MAVKLYNPQQRKGQCDYDPFNKKNKKNAGSIAFRIHLITSRLNLKLWRWASDNGTGDGDWMV